MGVLTCMAGVVLVPQTRCMRSSNSCMQRSGKERLEVPSLLARRVTLARIEASAQITGAK